MRFTSEEIAAVCNGSLVGNNFEFDNISTDTRTIKEGDFFIALVGENSDGHNYIETAVKNGAAALLVEKDGDYLVPYIKVSDTTKAYGKIAKAYKERFSIPFVAITGSVGKTTTKDMIAGVLSKKYNVLKTQGNFNNHIGVPITLLRLDESIECAVIEMGMNHFDEISYLTNLVNPDIAVITNVGVSHIENLGSREGILKAKCEIFEGMKKDGLKVLNYDNDMLRTVKDKYDNICYYSIDDNTEIYADNIKEKGIEGISCTIHTPKFSFDCDIKIPGRHMVENAMAATAVGVKLGLTKEEIASGISDFEPTGGRMEIIRCNDYTIINDVYNANPVSTKAGIDVLAYESNKTCCILGDMFELGTFADKLHYEVGQYAVKKGIDILVCIGSISKSMYEGATSVNGNTDIYYYATQDEFLDDIENIIEEDMTILVKASRGMHFEKTVEKLRGEN
ncbi:MAG: UDP-N-acetylmuramoyl-tripeptide--D-alanyl-D-alanine ligase [Lachnospirales bacterium]